MLIVCPSCASEYTIDPAWLGADGRTMRCARCRGTWFAARPGPPAPVEEAGDPRAPISVEARSERVRSAGPSQDPMPPPRRGRGRPLRLERRAKPRVGRLSAATALAALLLALGGGAVAGRAALVRTFPQVAGLYAAAGLPVNLRGLALHDVRSEVSTSDGATILVVEGEIRNVAGTRVDVPRLELAVRGPDRQALYTWTNDPPRPTLEPAETARFRARLASPPAEGRDILVRFAAGERAGEAGAVGRR